MNFCAQAAFDQFRGPELAPGAEVMIITGTDDYNDNCEEDDDNSDEDDQMTIAPGTDDDLMHIIDDQFYEY